MPVAEKSKIKMLPWPMKIKTLKVIYPLYCYICLFLFNFQSQTTTILTFLHTDFLQFLQEILKVTFNILMYPTSVLRTKWYCNFFLVKLRILSQKHQTMLFFLFFIKSLDCQATDHHPIPEQKYSYNFFPSD